VTFFGHGSDGLLWWAIGLYIYDPKPKKTLGGSASPTAIAIASAAAAAPPERAQRMLPFHKPAGQPRLQRPRFVREERDDAEAEHVQGEEQEEVRPSQPPRQGAPYTQRYASHRWRWIRLQLRIFFCNPLRMPAELMDFPLAAQGRGSSSQKSSPRRWTPKRYGRRLLPV
jgi:hypothetical protein